MARWVLLALMLLVVAGLMAGCGGGGGGSTGTTGNSQVVAPGTTPPTETPATTGSVTFAFTLKAAATDVEAAVTHFRVTFFNGTSIVSGPTTVAKAASVTLTGIPAGNWTMLLEYLNGGVVTANMTGPVTITGGGTTSIVNPPVNPVTANTPPTSTTPPSVSGTAQQGQLLTANDGTWSGTSPIILTRQWVRCDAAGMNPSDIAGANNTTYLVTAADVGSTLVVTVTGTNSWGVGAGSSPPSAVVTAAPPTPPSFTASAGWTPIANTGGGQPAVGSLEVPRGTVIKNMNSTTGVVGTDISMDGNTLVAVENVGGTRYATNTNFQIIRKIGNGTATVWKDFTLENLDPSALREEDGVLWVLLAGVGNARFVRGFNTSDATQTASFAVQDSTTCIEVLPGGRIVTGHGVNITVYNNSGTVQGTRNMGSSVSAICRLDNNFFAVAIGGTAIVAIGNDDNTLATKATYAISNVLQMVASLGGELYVVRSSDDCQRYDRL